MSPNGWRYPLVGGTRERHFAGINLKPHKRPKNAATPTSRVHALLGNRTERQARWLQKDNTAILTKLYNEPLLANEQKEHDLLKRQREKTFAIGRMDYATKADFCKPT